MSSMLVHERHLICWHTPGLSLCARLTKHVLIIPCNSLLTKPVKETYVRDSERLKHLMK